MKNTAKKLFSFLLAAMMLLGVFSVAMAEGESIGDVKILTNVTGGKDEAEMELFAKALSEGVNGNVMMEKPAANYGDVMMQKLNAGESYDLIYISVQQLHDLQSQGALVDLTDMVANSAILGNADVVPADEWDQVTVDGKIWAAFNKTEVQKLPTINKAVADKAGIDVDAIEPTLEGYYEVFSKMKEAMAGEENFYPFNATFKTLHDLQPWFSSVGVKAGIVAQEDGTFTVPYATEAAIPVWDWFAKLYADGLMDPDGLIGEASDMRNKFTTGYTGLVVDWAAWVGLYNVNAGENYPEKVEAYPLPGTKAEGGEFMLSRGDASLWAIPANATNPEGAFKVLEYFATQEGGELLSIGIEGHDWNMEGDKVVLSEVGQAHGKDHGAPLPTSRQYVSPVEWNPGFEKALEYLQYATVELSSSLKDKQRDVVAKYGTQIINGTMTSADGVAAMDKELKEMGIIQ